MAKLKGTNQITLTSLQQKMLSMLTLPMSEECPTALRYALAKYHAHTVAEAYEVLYASCQAGELQN